MLDHLKNGRGKIPNEGICVPIIKSEAETIIRRLHHSGAMKHPDAKSLMYIVGKKWVEIDECKETGNIQLSWGRDGKKKEIYFFDYLFG